jgi:hypothetical protein
MRGMRGSFVLAMAVALAAGAQEQAPPPLDLAPLVPPEAPWLQKNQKKPGTAQKKKSKKKKQAQEPKPGAPFVASPPSSPPPLPLAEPAKTSETAKPAEAAKPAPAQPIEAQLPLPPLVPPPAPAATPALPLLTLTSDLGVAVQNDGLDAAAAARVAEGLRGVARLAPHAKNAPLLPKPSQPCADNACWAAVAAALRVDQLLLANYAKGALKVELIDVATKKSLSSADQAAVPAEPAAATAWTEALACKLLVPAGCFGEASVNPAPGVSLEVDGTPLKSGDKRSWAVGMHSLAAHAGAKSVEGTFPVLRERATVLYVREVDGALRILDTPPAAPAVALQAPLPSPAPAPSWNKPVGYVALGAGAVAAGVGAYFGARSKSQINQAETAFRTNGGYSASDADLLSSGNSKAHTANALFVASGVLLAAGAIFTFAF